MVRKFRYDSVSKQVVEVFPGEAQEKGAGKPIISDALGFTEGQLAQFEADRIKHGFSDVEFVRDPQVPEFYQVKMGSEETKSRYMKHRGYHDRNSLNGGGAHLTPELLAALQRQMLERYPPRKQKSVC